MFSCFCCFYCYYHCYYHHCTNMSSAKGKVKYIINLMNTPNSYKEFRNVFENFNCFWKVQSFVTFLSFIYANAVYTFSYIRNFFFFSALCSYFGTWGIIECSWRSCVIVSSNPSSSLSDASLGFNKSFWLCSIASFLRADLTFFRKFYFYRVNIWCFIYC